MAEPKEVTELYRDLSRHPHLYHQVPSVVVGDVARLLYDLGYRKWARHERYVTGNTEWFLPDLRVDDFGGSREETTG